MIFQPKLTKYKKYHKGKISLKEVNSVNNFDLRYGTFGLKVTESGRITAKQLETLRRTIKKVIKRNGKIWINIFPHLPVSSKPNENRMGKGKGKTKYYTGKVVPGNVVVEILGVNYRTAFKALSSAAKKLPVKSYFIYI
jgi:large subunit ribosomal protein L16